MPREHSGHFKVLVTQKGNEHRLSPDTVQEKLQNGEIGYEAMSDLLRETNDAQFGIVSTLNKDNEWIRDATHAIPLEKRMSHDAPVIDANNTLLRCLSRLRPIDYAIDKKHGEKGKEIRDALKNRFGELSAEILKIAQGPGTDEEKHKQIHQKEKEFNTFLVEKLHEANLTQGCEKEEDAEKLLFHYRNLSSTLAPARTLVTLTYDKDAKILQRETQYPVTEKTEAQKETLNKLKVITPYPFKDESNSHTRQKIAFQEADSLFSDLIAQDDRALPAQARKTHLVSAKNAFIVKNELIEIEDEATLESPEAVDALNAKKEEDVLWLARMGSPVFVGKGEKSEVLQTHTRENLEQVRRTAAKKMGKDAESLNVHVTTLNTDSPLEHQSTIVDHVYQATRNNQDKKDNVSYVPTNPDGTFRVLDVAPELNFNEETQPSGSAPLQKATRLESVTKVMLAASCTANTISTVHCASGQDRTGTAVEKATQEWMKKRYDDKELDQSNIESMRAEGGNAAEITTHHVNGSPGMKTDSIANNFFDSKTTFSPRATEELYLSSAKTNKQNKIGDVAFLTKPSRLAVAEYNDHLEKFTANLAKAPRDDKEKQLIEKGKEVLKQVQSIAKDKPGELSSASLNDLTQVLATTNKSLMEAHEPKQSQENAKRLAALSHHVSGKSSSGWKALGIGLLTFASAVLVVAGVLAAIPTAGSSLLLAAVGVAGLAATVSAGAGVAAAGVTSAAMIHHGREKGLAKSISDFKNALSEIKTETQAKPEEVLEENLHEDIEDSRALRGV
ncbi:hypothetical protein [Legionella fallonii]|uniref:Uncharacterized protein n=1 Tax=Legionella fallonii LLAP-10 TaxID=1212491 RepID=A0A098G4M9_9GAMM|nr:hypothetical protein [Legionella fallonii]CEG56926.1 conserved protein of unknown function [Legionella fallonii LLAP-10]